MKISKDGWKAGEHTHATIYTNTYVKTLAHAQMLADVARKDYPWIKGQDDKIRVVIFGGERRKGMMGIEFEVNELQADYFVVNAPEPIA